MRSPWGGKGTWLPLVPWIGGGGRPAGKVATRKKRGKGGLGKSFETGSKGERSLWGFKQKGTP